MKHKTRQVKHKTHQVLDADTVSCDVRSCDARQERATRTAASSPSSARIAPPDRKTPVNHAAQAPFEAATPSRRGAVVALGSLGLLACFVPFISIKPVAAAEKVTWQDAMRALVGEATPELGRIALLMPETNVGGYMVPFTVTVDSPMTQTDHVRSVHVFATANPRPDVASFFFSPLSGRAQTSSRMRLWGTQDVVAVAELSDASVYLARRLVRVLPGQPTQTPATSHAPVENRR